jgi:predicted component of viral defense system (DUF524 family)
MADLFCIETDNVMLEWGEPRGGGHAAFAGAKPGLGLLVIEPRRSGLAFGDKTRRAGVPKDLETDPYQPVGPRLFEQTDYTVSLRSKSAQPVSLEHRDPVILRDLKRNSDLVYGVVNYGSQVGHSTFVVMVGSEEELRFTVEVFPSKLDYQSDYQKITAEIREVLTGLALDYLQSTFRSGDAEAAMKPSGLEWLTILRSIAGELELALRYIASRPHMGLAREPRSVRIETVRRVDATVRRMAVKQNAVEGGSLIRRGMTLRRRVDERRPRATLDTPEHRWISGQLVRIRRHIASLRCAESMRAADLRTTRTLEELDDLETRLVRMIQLEPFAAAIGSPPAEFASLQLLASPGYQQAYKLCMTLSLGLRLTGDAVELSVKDIAVLYEYWCYLTLVRAVGLKTGRATSAKDLFTIEQCGLRVNLQEGCEQTVFFEVEHGRRIRLVYNPTFQGRWILLPQQPDMMLSLEDPDWSGLHVILDAKYRIDSSQRYVDSYKSPGPPEDALNVLHRYRDAILESKPDRPRRTVVYALALFPYQEPSPGSFLDGHLWGALKNIGLGAIPLLPDSTAYLERWLDDLLNHTGWDLAECAIPHRATEKLAEWRLAASQPVIVGSLRGGAPRQHFDWIRSNGAYYTRLTKQPRQLSARYLALYSPETLRKRGAITHWAEVIDIDIVERGGINTPWPARKPAERQVLYRLGSILRLPQPVENLSGQRFPPLRWTSRLGLLRARRLEELSLETEPEWRLYDALVVNGLDFKLEPEPPRGIDLEDPVGRTWFRVGRRKVQYRGADGFLVTSYDGNSYHARVEDVLHAIWPLRPRSREAPGRGPET